MKKYLLIAYIYLLLAISTQVFAQNPASPNAIVFKTTFMDYHTMNDSDLSSLKSFSNGYEIGYLRNINPYINLYFPIRAGVLDIPNSNENTTMAGFDATLQLQYFKEENRLTPYLSAGAGIVTEDLENANLQLPVGVGLYFKITPQAYLNLQAEYRKSLDDDRDNLQYAIGFSYNFHHREIAKDSDEDGIPDIEDKCPHKKGSIELMGCPDKDMDGVSDKDDECPDDKGTVENQGCPDSDNDGIADNKDDCPDIAGKKELGGCPDSDGDGIADDDDLCPNKAGTTATDGCPDNDGDGIADKKDDCPFLAGVAKFNGCPDTDGDGISDKQDNCPDVAGLAKFKGCADTDNDGIADPNDKCPTTAGSATNFGCPEITPEEKEVLEFAMGAVEFQTGKTTLKAHSYEILDQIIEILNKYPDYKIRIEGHTDSVGSEDLNQELSERRAESCYTYLFSKGVHPERIKYLGYGETRPIADNGSRRGREKNRRVEFNLYVE